MQRPYTNLPNVINNTLNTYSGTVEERGQHKRKRDDSEPEQQHEEEYEDIRRMLEYLQRKMILM
jgi:hypothetical protein